MPLLLLLCGAQVKEVHLRKVSILHWKLFALLAKKVSGEFIQLKTKLGDLLVFRRDNLEVFFLFFWR
tara:strand:- start:1806 stop:2006 length:201 start_codon:yes stop_codon:yes gene_type:complete